MKKINTQGIQIYTFKHHENDYISLTDIAKYKDSERTDYIIQNWMRNRDTIEFLGIWEQLNNPDFNPIEFDGFKNNAGSNSFSLTPKRWIESVGAIGLISKSGRYGGGTFAHKDIAFEFATWISAEFKLYLIKEFQRLKVDEADILNKALFGMTAQEWKSKNKNKEGNMRDYKVFHVNINICHIHLPK